jgi:putative transposase
MIDVEALAPEVGLVAACDALDVPRANVYRRRSPPSPQPPAPRPRPARALSDEERERVLATLNEPRFVDKAPAEIYAILLDEGGYVCSERTMYRVLKTSGQVRERRDQLRHPHYVKPELVATRPNEVWSWDITKLRGPTKGSHYSLYVIIDIFSRYIVGWYVTTGESGKSAEHLFRETFAKHGIQEGQLTVHADRGSPMTSKPLGLLLADLGLTKSHSRPHVSDDNPYSEAQFKTLKYRPEFPDRFGSPEDARSFCRTFFTWYNDEHRHSGIEMLTPADVHYGRAQLVIERRAEVLAGALAAHPERFVRGTTRTFSVPTEAWINRPSSSVSSKIDMSDPSGSVVLSKIGESVSSKIGESVSSKIGHDAPRAGLAAPAREVALQ